MVLRLHLSFIESGFRLLDAGCLRVLLEEKGLSAEHSAEVHSAYCPRQERWGGCLDRCHPVDHWSGCTSCKKCSDVFCKQTKCLLHNLVDIWSSGCGTLLEVVGKYLTLGFWITVQQMAEGALAHYVIQHHGRYSGVSNPGAVQCMLVCRASSISLW